MISFISNSFFVLALHDSLCMRYSRRQLHDRTIDDDSLRLGIGRIKKSQGFSLACLPAFLRVDFFCLDLRRILMDKLAGRGS